MYAPTVTLTFDLEPPNSIGSSISHDQPLYQARRSLGYEFSNCLRTDRHVQSNIPHFFEGGIII